VVTEPPPPDDRHRIRELVGTLVGLAVLVVAGLGILWATNGRLGGEGSRHTNVVHGSSPSQPSATQRPVGVPANAQALTVRGASDGDSMQAQPARAGSPIATTTAVVVRLIGIAAPARPAIGGKAQCFAEDAFRALLRLTPIGSRVWVIADAQLRDPEDRYLLYVWNSAGTFVNLALADGGYVRAATMKPNVARQGAIKEAISGAMAAHRGLWGRCRTR
jgi:endonuclease YncB( thermonuclease family)